MFLSSGGAAQQIVLSDAAKPGFTLAAGTIMDAVAALFFVQSNKARQFMTEFFDKLRIDRKLEEALRLAREIDDVAVKSLLKALLALNFTDVASAASLTTALFGRDAPAPPLTPGPAVLPPAAEAPSA